MLTHLVNEDKAKKLNRKPRLITVDIDDICINKNNNHKRVRNIDRLAEDIRVNGLMKPLEVYKYTDDLYMLIGGERRYTACKKLVKMDLLDPEIPCLLYEVERGVKEIIQIHQSNAQEPLEEEDRITVAKDMLKCLKEDPSIKPAGMLTRDWLAPYLQCKSGKTAQKYINIVNGKTDDEKTPKTKKNEVDYGFAKNLMVSRLRTKVDIKNNKVSIYFKDTDDLNAILDRMNMLDGQS